ncbi:MAG: type I-E CRISPR-associated endoribonuclease Cas2e [Flavimaricola sp.]|nr:type I-E CRISPR-associated endoribonuclease Cas2e [Flavimaricola sp.]
MTAQTTLIITRDVEARYRGFLTSIMLEVAPGVYVSPQMSAGVRGRTWAVVSDWWSTLQRGSLVMMWRDKSAAANLRIETLGEPAMEIIDADGVLLLKRK